MRLSAVFRRIAISAILAALGVLRTCDDGGDVCSLWSDTGSLVIVAVSKDGIVVAADGIECPLGGAPVKCWNRKKLDRLGTGGAIGFVGKTQGTLTMSGRVVASIDLHELTRDLEASTSAMQFEEAFKAVVQGLQEKWISYMMLSPPSTSDERIFRVVATGYSGDGPVVWVADFYPKSPAHSLDQLVKEVRNLSSPGKFYQFGVWDIVPLVTNGQTDGFKTYRNESAVLKVRKAFQARREQDLTAQDFLEWSDVCLRATESDEARLYVPDSIYVGAPNQFGIITKLSGLNWVSVDAR